MNEHPDIHLPAPSFWPIVLAFGFSLIAIGIVSSIIISLIGVVVTLFAITGWTLENRADAQEERHE